VHSDPLEIDDYLIVGGADHKTGQDDDPEHRFSELERWTRQRFPMAGAIERTWSGQVLEPIDNLAYIGRFDRGARNVFCISGDSGQGMTHGTMAGMIIADLIEGRDNPYAELYAPSRKTLAATGNFLSEQGNNVRQYAEWITPGEAQSANEIEPNSGAVLRQGIRKIAVYRDPGGAIHEMSAACTHLGCVVNWNPVEHTWDCPCHGSRFNPVGVVISGPATDNLRPVEHPVRTSRR
jgi:Rieske Fe-S protein